MFSVRTFVLASLLCVGTALPHNSRLNAHRAGGYSEFKAIEEADAVVADLSVAALKVVQPILAGMPTNAKPVSYAVQVVDGANYKIHFVVPDSKESPKSDEAFELEIYKNWRSTSPFVLKSIVHRYSLDVPVSTPDGEVHILPVDEEFKLKSISESDDAEIVTIPAPADEDEMHILPIDEADDSAAALGDEEIFVVEEEIDGVPVVADIVVVPDVPTEVIDVLALPEPVPEAIISHELEFEVSSVQEEPAAESQDVLSDDSEGEVSEDEDIDEVQLDDGPLGDDN